MRLLLPGLFRLGLISGTAVLLLVIGIDARAQSSDARAPTPVSSDEIVDSIAARDIGDSRLTDYFYTFTGLPGDLLITLESKNLNGDIDVFTAGELRPLLKITFYAESSSSLTKNIYLRKRESLILRVEARTPNDDPGTYRIRFSGSFEPIGGTSLVAESEKSTETNRDSSKTSDRKTTRVSSVGARLEEPVEEVVAAPTPKPTPEATPAPVREKAATKQPAKEPAVRTVRGRRPPAKSTTKPSASETARDRTKDPSKGSDSEKPARGATTIKPSETESSAAETATGKIAADEEEKKPESAGNKPSSNRRSSVGKTPARPRAPKPEPQPENQGRLVIEEKDGTRRIFLMSTIRKVTVENGKIVVVDNDGNIQRISMTTVERMSIGP